MRDIDIPINTANAKIARDSTRFYGIILDPMVETKRFPVNVSEEYTGSIPCKIKIGEKTTGSVTYDAYFCYNNGTMFIEVDNQADVLEKIRGTGKTFTGIGFTGISGFMPAPGVNSQTKYDQLFNF